MFQLQPFFQNYAWGKKGNDSLVGRLIGVDQSKKDVPYAELWMGTHPSGPCRIIPTQELFSSWIQRNEAAIGVIPPDSARNDLPFLFKVLSIEKALSIQAHPDKVLAKSLHEKFPSIYKDSNHKPEMVIALTEFHCICGFRHFEEILQLLADFPEFIELLRKSHFDPFLSGENLRTFFSHYIRSDPVSAKECIQLMVRRLRGKTSPLSLLEETILILDEQFPGDIGVFAPIMLNLLVLQPGESFFIGANEPHAYLKGDCIECMALSDNVVRAGLTDKLRDVEILCSMLTFRSGQPQVVTPVKMDEVAVVYRPPYHFCPEFAVEKITLQPFQSYNLLYNQFSSILLVLEGAVVVTGNSTEGERNNNYDLSSGSIVFIGAGNSVTLQNNNSTQSFLYRAHINMHFEII